jgi:hypothetical protein
VTELIQEEFSPDGAKLRQQSLNLLKITIKKPEGTPKKPEHRGILLEAVRLMLPAGGHLKDALRKVMTNQEILEKSRQGLGAKLRTWLQKRFQSRGPSWTVELRYFDSRTSTSQSESLEYQKFVETVRRKSSLLDALNQPDSTSFARLSQAAEQQIDAFLKKNIEELQLFYRRLQGLNEVLRDQAPEGQKEQLKGIKIEMSGLKNCIIRANRRRYEYVALKEEERRLKQLGVVE